MKYSYSSLSLYNQCQFAFFLKYILKYQQERHDNSIYGEIIHFLFKKEVDKILDDNYVETEYGNNYEYRGYRFDGNVYKFMENEDILKSAVDDFIDEYLQNVQTLKIFKYIETASKIETEFDIINDKFNGSIDLFIENDEEAIILDYKTGKSVFASFYQLELYSSIVFLLNPNIKIIYLNLYFIAEDTMKKKKITKEEALLFWESVENQIKVIEKQKDFDKNLSHCKNCVMKKACDEETLTPKKRS